MAKYRAIYQTIWKDPDFQRYTPEAKLAFIYLCTNESTSESGIYPITEKTIADETGLKKEAITKLLDNYLKNVVYDFQTRFVYIRKFRLYNSGGRPELIQKAVASEYKLNCQTYLWSLFIKDYPDFKNAILTIGTPPTPPTNSNTNTNTKGKGIEPLDNGSPTVTKPLDLDSNFEKSTVSQRFANGLPTVCQRLDGKKPFGEFANILLTDEEYKKLVDRFGEKEANDRIKAASESFKSHKNYPAKYLDHYATILTWARLDEKRQQEGNNGTNKRISTGRQLPQQYSPSPSKVEPLSKEQLDRIKSDGLPRTTN